MNPKQYTENLTVTSEHLDELHHVNNVVYLQWVQQVAEHHWRKEAPDHIQKQYIWVVLNHFIRYNKPALLDDQLVLKTFVGEIKGAKCIRHVEIRRGDELLAEAKTEWCMLEAMSMRPRRISDEIINAFFNEGD